MAGGTLALLVAQWINGSLLLFLPPNIARILPNLSFRHDAHVLGFTAALTLATCLLFGLAPALQATRSAPLTGLRQTPGAGHTSPGWLSRGLAVHSQERALRHGQTDVQKPIKWLVRSFMSHGITR